MFKLNLNSIVKTTLFLSTVCAMSVLKAAELNDSDVAVSSSSVLISEELENRKKDIGLQIQSVLVRSGYNPDIELLTNYCKEMFSLSDEFKNRTEHEFNAGIKQATEFSLGMARGLAVYLVVHIINGDHVMVDENIRSGMSVETENVDGLHLSHLAVYMGQLNALKALHKNGADLSAVDRRGFSVYEYASFTSKILITQEQRDRERLKNLNASSLTSIPGKITTIEEKITARKDVFLNYPRIIGCLECEKYICSLNANDVVDSSKFSSFQSYFEKDTAKEKAFSFIKDNKGDDLNKLLDQNLIDINAQNEERATLLIYATQYDRADIVQSLLGRGVDINARNYLDRTALGMSKSAIAEILKQFGATEV